MIKSKRTKPRRKRPEIFPAAQLPEAVTIYPDGREKVNRDNRAGQKEWKRRKEIIHTRDKGRCQLRLVCDGKRELWNDRDFTLDHVIPKGLGGGTHDDRLSNLQLSCHACNIRKASQRIPRKVLDAEPVKF